MFFCLQDPDETAGEDDHHSDYGEGDLEGDGDLDGDGPNVQPLDSSDEERAPDDDDQLDDQSESDRESVTVDDEREEGDGQVSNQYHIILFPILYCSYPLG